jgi:hypothetical protein
MMMVMTTRNQIEAVIKQQQHHRNGLPLVLIVCIHVSTLLHFSSVRYFQLYYLLKCQD